MTTASVQHRFAGKVAIVTGAASGIGHAVAAAFASEGATVYGVDIDRQGLDRSAHSMSGAGHFIPITADVAVPGDISACVERVLSDTGCVDALVNNAGINMAKRIADLEIADWDRVFDTNLRSVYLFCKAVWPNFVSRRGGVIVNVASVMGQVGGVGSPAYCSAKAGMIMLSRCLAKDGARDGIRVNSVCPGYIDTPIMEKVLREAADPARARREIIDKMPLGRMGLPREIAAGILFLASADAGYISGTELTIDGAVTATQID
ncbi:MAG TPA: SDR family oxidoreductase [Steroidobacteraceae bacterium]|nr:SDR family oxidoreductase [Steroidobacteraceae bacterium]